MDMKRPYHWCQLPGKRLLLYSDTLFSCSSFPFHRQTTRVGLSVAQLSILNELIIFYFLVNFISSIFFECFYWAKSPIAWRKILKWFLPLWTLRIVWSLQGLSFFQVQNISSGEHVKEFQGIISFLNQVLSI